MKTRLEKILAAALLALLTIAATQHTPRGAPGTYIQFHGTPNTILDTTTGQLWVMFATATNGGWQAMPPLGTTINMPTQTPQK